MNDSNTTTTNRTTTTDELQAAVEAAAVSGYTGLPEGTETQLVHVEVFLVTNDDPTQDDLSGDYKHELNFRVPVDQCGDIAKAVGEALRPFAGYRVELPN